MEAVYGQIQGKGGEGRRGVCRNLLETRHLEIFMFLAGENSNAYAAKGGLRVKKCSSQLKRMVAGVYSTVLGNQKWKSVFETSKGQLATGGARGFGEGRQLFIDGTSRMNREVQVRICEGLGVKFPGPTRRR